GSLRPTGIGCETNCTGVFRPLSLHARFCRVVRVTPEKLGGTPVFRGTRIPVRVLFDYLKEGYTVDAFLEQYEIDPNLLHGFIEALRDSFTTDRKAEV
ncbi:DUF433 domain-containing protein, partial [Salinibacter ruber]|uniref:DUF433 domain-containing protein n=1 Tax=Salinibacter ruber TaxID=146919 RepID=UPI002169C095